MKLSLRLDEDDDLKLSALAEAAGIARAAWLRGAIRAASDSTEMATMIATRADNTSWGGYRDGAGRPRKS